MILPPNGDHDQAIDLQAFHNDIICAVQCTHNAASASSECDGNNRGLRVIVRTRSWSLPFSSDILWVQLHRLGCAGPIIDWLRSLYENMRYIVRSNGEESEEFESEVGVLIGDPSSPTLWNIFLSNFDPPEHPDDPWLGQARIDNLEHADDGALLSLSGHGLQCKLSYLFSYAGMMQLLTNAIKTYCLIFNQLPERPLTLYLGKIPLSYVLEATYLGITFGTNTKNLFARHIELAAEKATRASWAISGTEGILKDFHPRIARLLYAARLDCVASSGADVAPDVDNGIALLEKAQIAFLRRTLGLSGHSMKTPLFTELKLMPVRHRRATLALRFLKYALGQPVHRLVRVAMDVALDLYADGISGWVGDLAFALRSLQQPVVLPSAGELRRPGAVDNVIARVDASLRAQLLHDINTSPKLYLMKDRLEPQRRGEPKKTLMQFRHYLHLRDKDERKAFIRILASEHPFALDKFRHAYTRNYKKYSVVPRERRLCRMCAKAVESPEHALLTCTGNNEMTAVRDDFISRIAPQWPEFSPPRDDREAVRVLKSLLAQPKIAGETGRYINNVFDIFDTVALDSSLACGLRL